MIYAINLTDMLITLFVAAAYVICIVHAFFKNPHTLIVTIAVPAVSFLMVSLFRSRYDAKRPYEVYGIAPAIKKDTSGKSFPSRHVFSIFVIGMTVLIQSTFWGALILVLGIVLAAIRVAGGVHFIKDVAAGATAGLICGIVGHLIGHLIVFFS